VGGTGGVVNAGAAAPEWLGNWAGGRCLAPAGSTYLICPALDATAAAVHGVVPFDVGAGEVGGARHAA
jgi:hypothetical protein